MAGPNFPGGEYGYRVKLFYDSEMRKAHEMLAKNPSIKADQAWWDRYSQDAQRRAVEYVDAQQSGGNRYLRGTAPTAPTAPTASTPGGGRPPLSSFGG